MTLVNPSFDDLIAALHSLPNNPRIDLYQYPHIVEYDPATGFRVTIKCRGGDCKTREVIGFAEGIDKMTAEVTALLRANGVEVKYT